MAKVVILMMMEVTRMTDNKKIKRRTIITKALKEIIIVNQSIIEGYKSQKARAEKLLDKYQNLLQTEADRPANRYLDWVKVIDPFIDNVVTSKSIDWELIKRLESYIDQLIKHDSEFLIAQDELDDLQDNFENMVTTILKLEESIIEERMAHGKELMRIRLRRITDFQELPDVMKDVGSDRCISCGKELDDREGDHEKECANCVQVPARLKPNFAQSVSSTLKDFKQNDDEPEILPVEEVGEDDESGMMNEEPDENVNGEPDEKKNDEPENEVKDETESPVSLAEEFQKKYNPQNPGETEDLKGAR